MTDGSFTAVTYSMPVHYKVSGSAWKEIDTTLVKSGKNKYKTKATELSIKVSQKANKKSVVSLKRGKSRLSIGLSGKKLKKVKAKVNNPKKAAQTDVLNQNTVTYKKVLKNTNVSYDIFPEKLQEFITVTKKQKNKALSFKLGSSLKVKIKGKKIYFKTKKGKTKYTRLATLLTDANGVTTSKVKLSYNKKTKTLKVTPDKRWWNSKKRKFPLEIRTSYITDQHERDVKVGAAYTGSPDSNFSYDKYLLLQANKCVAFTKMSTLSTLKQENVQIRDAALHIQNKTSLKMGAGKTFEVGAHKVTQSWSVSKLTYHNRPAYEPNAVATMALQKKGNYQCDVTDIVKAWYTGEANYGIALVADNSNQSYQAKIDRNPYFTIHYEVVGFDGAVELKENEPITRAVLIAGQENYYYFDAKQSIAYDLYSESSADTQATMYDKDKNQVDYSDDSGRECNFSFIGAYNDRRYLKVSIKDKGTGSYTLYLKKRFAMPEPVGIFGQDKYTITWDTVENAKEYLVCVYDEGKKISEAVVTGTSYDYIYTNETAGKTLGFTVTAREDESLTGEESRMIYNTARQSEWSYAVPMHEKRKNVSAVSQDGKIYVLGGENESGALKTFEVYDTGKKKWNSIPQESLPDYPGTTSGICKAAMFAYGNEIYVIGGQTGTGSGAELLKSVYAFDVDTKKWQKKADLAEGRTNLAIAVCKDMVYAFSRAGKTDQAEVYDIKKDKWETAVLPDTSRVIDAASVDNRVFVLKEEKDGMAWEEYLSEDNIFEEAGVTCTLATADSYQASAVISGKIYMVKEGKTKEVLVYDAYADEWSRISDMNLVKKDSVLVSSGNEIYNIGGEMTGFGVLDVVEQYSVKVKTITKQMVVKKGESYELQVVAGNLKKGQTKVVTLSVDTDEMQIEDVSSFEEEAVLKKGDSGVTLLKYQPKKGVMVLKLTGSMEQGETYETYQSVPVLGLIDGKTKVEITMAEV